MKLCKRKEQVNMMACKTDREIQEEGHRPSSAGQDERYILNIQTIIEVLEVLKEDTNLDKMESEDTCLKEESKVERFV